MADDTNILPNDQNFVRAAGFESSSTPGLVMAGQIDELTGRILVDSAGGGGSGTVASVSVVTANGVSGSVATATTTPAITLTLGAITPSAIQVSGLTASQIVITDASKNLVSASVATYPSLTELTYLKGVTSAIQTQINTKQATITFGTGVQTALGVNIGSAGAPVLFNGALGTPSSGTVTNLTGTASININGTVGATTPTTGVFTTLVAGSTTSLLLGTAGSAVGNIGFRNATSGTITLAPVTGALGTVTLTLPAITDTLVTLTASQTLTNKTLTSPSIASPTITTEWDFGAHTAGFTETDNGNSSTADTIDWRVSNKQKSTLTGNVTYTFTAPTKPCSLILKLLTGAGSFTVTWPATVKWSGGTAPTITTTASRADIIAFYWDGAAYYGSFVQNFTP